MNFISSRNVKKRALVFGILPSLLAACGGSGSSDGNGSANNGSASSSVSATVTPELSDKATSLPTAPSPSTTYELYVSTQGKDSNPGTRSAPFLTIAAASRAAKPSTTIHVAAGTYAGNFSTSISGTSSSHVIYVSDMTQGAKIVGTGTGIAWTNSGNYIEVNGFDISTSGSLAFYSTGSFGSIYNCLVHDVMLSGGKNGNGGAGIDVLGSNWYIYDNIIRNIDAARVTGDSSVQGIYISGANTSVHNNLISGVAAYGIQQWHGATASTIVNNTIFNTFGGILIGAGDGGALPNGSQNNYVANNISVNNLGYGIREYGITSKNTYVDNLVYNNPTNTVIDSSGDVVKGPLVANPLFVDYLANGTGDYHLQTLSPANNLGALPTPIPAPPPTPTPTPTPTPATTTTYSLYVATSGSDSNSGTQSAPFLTIEAASRAAKPSTTIHVAAGTYSGNISTGATGTTSAHIIYISDVAQGAKIVGTGTGIAWINSGNYIEVSGFDISTSGSLGFYSTGSYGSIHNCLVHDIMLSGGKNGNGGAAIDFIGSNWTVYDNIIRNIDIARVSGDSSVQGIYIAGANALVHNNLISGVAAYGIQQWHGATTSIIVNNTVFNSFGGILIGAGDGGALANGSQNNYVANNISVNNVGYGIREYGVTSKNTYVDNLVFNNQTNTAIGNTGDVISGTIIANPLFVSYLANGTGNYRLQPGSPAIGSGTPINAPITDLVDAGWSGTKPNIGAY